MSTFKKLSELSPEDRRKVKNYWSDLWGSEFSSAAVEDYDTDAKTKPVKAKSDSKSVTAKKEKIEEIKF